MMKHILTNILIIVPLVLFGQNKTSSNNVNIIDSLFSNYDTIGSPGIAISVYKGNNTILLKQFGYADIENQTKINKLSKFQLGTLSNFVTAIAVLKLVDEGKLALNDTIIKILNDLPSYLNTVTIIQLLQNTSCIPAFMISDNDNFNDEQIMNFIQSQNSLTDLPGTKYSPSDANYYLLTKIIEAKTGLTYWKYIKRKIFIPLQINNSYIHNFKKKKVKTTDLVNSYNLGNKSIAKNETAKNLRITGLSDIYMAQNDFSKLVNVYISPSFLSQNSISELTKIKFFYNSSIYPSIAWKAKFNTKQKYLFISNTYLGCTHLMLYVPIEKITVIILSNQYPIFNLLPKSFEIVNLFSEKIDFDPYDY